MTTARTKRIPLAERRLPDYTRTEEMINMITHIVGGTVALVVLVGSIIIGAMHRNAWAVVSGSIYGTLTAALFIISSIYHGMRDCLAKRVMQVI
ncbi:MAG: hemolysin III family protein, partial [Oscillospiraceae bacterium]|nr:hemolysin III family protein [Oscillospiraceae bacterium]